MTSSVQALRFDLQPRALYTVPDAAEVEIRCLDGSLWVTLDHDPRDLVLEPGEHLSSDQHRAAVIYALTPSTVGLRARGAGVSPVDAVLPRAAQGTARRRLGMQLTGALTGALAGVRRVFGARLPGVVA